MKRRFWALLLTLAMAIGFTTSAFADEPAKPVAISSTSVSEEVSEVYASEEVSPRAAGKQLASNATTIYGGSGSLSVYLPSGNFWADLQAGIGYTSQNGIVNVSVTTPNGDLLILGNISGSGSYTSTYQLFYAPAGTYTFYFSSGNSSPMEVVAYIFD